MGLFEVRGPACTTGPLLVDEQLGKNKVPHMASGSIQRRRIGEVCKPLGGRQNIVKKA